jgi:hypothetical protein
VLAGSGYELFWSPSNAYERVNSPQLSEQSSMEWPGKEKGERGERVGGEGGERKEGEVGSVGGEREDGGVGGEGAEVALSGGRKRRLEEGREEKVIERAGVVAGKEREALHRSQKSIGCGCQYPGQAPVPYTDTLQRYITQTHPPEQYNLQSP